MSDDPAAVLVYRLVDTSIRWGFLIAALAAWLAILPPRRAATRHALCAAVLLVGPLLAVFPRWGDAAIPWPTPASAPPAPTPPPLSSLEPSPSIAAPRDLIAEPFVEIETVAAVELPAPPPPAPFDWPRIAARTAAGAWLAGTLMMLARLLLGVMSLARWSRRAVPATADDLALFDECRAAMPTPRPVRLARHPGTPSPIVVGGLRPTILLPDAWDERPTDQRRAALWHELAHVRRYDDTWKLLQELIRVPSWHHPLVHWLMGRLDRERELLCDEAAVALGDDPKGLARLLLELSRRPTGRRPASTSLPFLDRRTTAIRIERLLEDDMTRSLSRPSWFRTLTVGPLALAAALGLGGLRVRLAEASSAPSVLESTLDASASAPADSTPSVVSGRVRDAQDRTIPSAIVVVTPYDRRARQVVTTDGGRFKLTGLSPNDAVHFLFWAPGFLPISATPIPSRLQNGTALDFHLEASVPFSAILVDHQGNPLGGASVRLTQLAFSVMQDEHGGTCQYAYLDPESPVADLAAITGEDGSFSLPYASAGRITEVKLEVVTRDGRVMVSRQSPNAPHGLGGSDSPAFVKVSPDVTSRITVVPAARLQGRVTSRVAGVDLTDLRVHVSRTGRRRGLHLITERWLRPLATVAADGRFVLDGIDEDALDVRVEGPGRNLEWVTLDAEEVRTKSGETREVSLEIQRGVKVEGRVVERTSGRPARNVAVFAYAPKSEFNPMLDLSLIVRTDSEGRYRVCVPAGDRIFAADARGDLRPPKGDASRLVTVPDGDKPFEVPTLEIPHYVLARFRVVDADRRPIAGAKVSWHTKAGDGAEHSVLDSATDADGWVDRMGRLAPILTTIPADQPLDLEVVLPGGKEHKLQIQPAVDGLVEVVMPRREGGGDEFTGQVVDPRGRPIAGAVGLETPSGPTTRRVVADAEGRFSLAGVDMAKPTRFVFFAPGHFPLSPMIPYLARPRDSRWVYHLPEAEPFTAQLVDERGEPIAGATVRLTQVAVVESKDAQNGTCRLFPYRGEWPVPGLTTTTSADGSFTLPYGSKSGKTEVNLEIRTQDGRMMVPQTAASPLPFRVGFPATIDSVAVSTTEKTQITAVPAARVVGKIDSQVPGVDLSRLRVRVGSSWTRFCPREEPQTVPVTADGRFAFDNLSQAKVDLRVEGPGRDHDWIAADARDVQPTLGATIEASLSLIPGVEVSGKVVERKTGRPLAGVTFSAQVANSQFFDQTVQTRTDAEGGYRLRLAPRRYVFGVDVCNSATLLEVESKRFATIPEGVDRFEAPTIEAAPYVVPRVRVVDADHRPVADAKVTVSVGKPIPFVPAPSTVTSTKFEAAGGDYYSATSFQITSLPGTADTKSTLDNLMLKSAEFWRVAGKSNADGRLVVDSWREKVPGDEPATVEVVAPGGQEHKVRGPAAGDGVVEVVLPPREKAAEEFKGAVLDPDGKPVPGATVVIEDVGGEAPPGSGRVSLTSDDRGRYSCKVDSLGSLVRVMARAPGFVSAVGTDSFGTNPKFNAESGRDFNIRLDRPGDFGGVLVDRDGRPIAGARIQATQVQLYQAAGGNRMVHRFRLPTPDDPRDPPSGRLPVDATTAADGSFRFAESLPKTETTLWLEITDAQGRSLTVLRPRPNLRDVPPPLNAAVFQPGDRPTVTAAPASWIEGRVSTKVPGLDLSRLEVEAVSRESKDNPFLVHPRGQNRVKVQGDGRYRIGPVVAAPVDLVLHGPGETASWTYRVSDDLKPPVDGTLHVDLEAIQGVEVVGRVIDSMEARGLSGVVVEARPGGRTAGTDSEGFYHLRLPAGEARIVVRALPVGFESIPAVGSERKIVVPQGVDRFKAPGIVAAKLTDLH